MNIGILISEAFRRTGGVPHHKKRMKELTHLALFAGMLIGIGGLTYLNVGGLAGAILFSFGLISVVLCKAQLYTGKAGFMAPREWARLLYILLGNAVGCLATATLTLYATKAQLFEGLDAILAARHTAPWHGILLMAIGTGLIMTLAVYGTMRKNYLPLLFGVPVFILCGLPHCVADAFYYAIALLQGDAAWWMLGAWAWAIVGNYIGCNLPRILMGGDLKAE